MWESRTGNVFIDTFAGFFTQTVSFNVGKYRLEPEYWTAIAVVFLLFLLVFTFARLRWLYVHWSTGKSAIAFTVWGFILAFVVEGFFLIGGRTLIAEVIGWEKAPKPVRNVLDMGQKQLAEKVLDDKRVLGSENDATPEGIISNFSQLPGSEKEKVHDAICKPAE